MSRCISKIGTHQRAGFTLIELMLVLALTTILMHSMSMIFRGATQIINITESENETRQSARNVFSRLRVDLQGAIVDKRGNYFQISNSNFSHDGRTCASADLRFVTTTRYNPERIQGRTGLTQLAYRSLNKTQSEQVRSDKWLPAGHSEAPLLVRYALVHLTEEMRLDINSKRPAEQPPVQVAYPEVSLDNPDAPVSRKMYMDILAGHVLDFRVDRLNNSAVASLPSLELSRIDSYWLNDNFASSANSPLPMAIRVSITVADSKQRIERSFESFFPIRFQRSDM